MIESISHKGLKLFWEKEDSSKLPSQLVEKIRRVLSVLNVITDLNPLREIPGYKLHSLKGKYKGFFAVSVSGNYRIVFRFENENVLEIDLIDYH